MAETIKVDDLTKLLENDEQVKVGGIDVDGLLRGKLISKEKFVKGASHGFGFCSAVFGWDLHDLPYLTQSKVGNSDNGFRDILAVPDLSSFRRIPWEDNTPFFMLDFIEPESREPVSACPRSLLRRIVEQCGQSGWQALAGIEFEFFNFKPKDSTAGIQRFLEQSPAKAIPTVSEGVHCYSLTKVAHSLPFGQELSRTCREFDCKIEGWHMESGPGVFEAALAYDDVQKMGDKAALFKYTAKSIGTKHGLVSCFMAKPMESVPGCSGHMHVSVVDDRGRNLFMREQKDPDARWNEIAFLSDFGRYFLAGVLEGIPDALVLFAPTVNSYKRFVEGVWAPTTACWGYEHRSAAVRLLGPPTTKSTATRLEVRLPGADANPCLALAVILALGLRGVDRKLDILTPPIGSEDEKGDSGALLAKTLKEATVQFARPESIAREVLGDDFVDHFVATREHEMKLWNNAVTDWEVQRYIESI